jgi:hypothetical protein
MKAIDFQKRITCRFLALSLAMVVTVQATVARAQDETLVRAGDIVYGLSRSDPLLSMELIRGATVENGGEVQTGLWIDAFIQSVELDNLNGISHNPNGNLLGLTFGTTAAGGTIFNLATLGSDIPGQLIGNTTGLGGEGIDTTRLGGLSISPDNSKIAVTGYDTGRVIFFDYTAGDGLASGASLSGARQSEAGTFPPFSTQGTAWFDSNSVLHFGTDGVLRRIDATTLESTTLATVETGTQGQSSMMDIEYNPTVSPYVYASNGAFANNTTTNQLYVFDPAANFALVATADFSLSSQTFREIALGPDGDLFIAQFSGLIGFIPDVTDPQSITDNSAVAWYGSIESPSFSGIDVAIGLPIEFGGIDGDFNGDGILDAADINALTSQVVAGTNAAEFDLNSDGLVNGTDRDVWVEQLKGTYFGDANLDGEFSTSDLVTVFQPGQYEDQIAGNSVWETGDWSGDQEFNSTDIVLAFQKGGFEQGPRAAVASVPEPSSAALITLGLLALVRRR